MIVWFLAIGATGIAGITLHPEILKALFPFADPDGNGWAVERIGTPSQT